MVPLIHMYPSPTLTLTLPLPLPLRSPLLDCHFFFLILFDVVSVGELMLLDATWTPHSRDP